MPDKQAAGAAPNQINMPRLACYSYRKLSRATGLEAYSAKYARTLSVFCR